MFLKQIMHILHVAINLSSCYSKRTYLGAVYTRGDIQPDSDISPGEIQQNGEFYFIKTNRLYENEFISPRKDLNSTQVN